MKKLLLGVVVGFMLAGALSASVVILVKNEKYKHGHGVGYLDGQAETIAFLRKHFKVDHISRRTTEMKDVLSTKAGNVFVVETNVVVTIEVD